MGEYSDYLYRQYQNIKDNPDDEYIFLGDSIEPQNKVKKGNDDRKKIHTDLLPFPVCGDIENGKIFICSLNPSYDKSDYEVENDPKLRDIILNQLDQKHHRNRNFFLSYDVEKWKHQSGFDWWQRRFDQKDKSKSLVEKIVKEYECKGKNVTKEDVFKMLSRIVVSIELYPYHSNPFEKKFFKGCKSVDKVKAFITDEILPHAEANDQLVCFARSHKEWNAEELKRDYPESVVVNPTPRSIYFNWQRAMGDAIYKKIKKYTEEFSIEPNKIGI